MEDVTPWRDRSATINRILCIRPDGIGDMVCALPAFVALRRAHPAAHLTVMASPLNAPIIKADPAVSETLVVDRQGSHQAARGMYALVRSVRRARYDAVIVMRTATYTNVLAATSGAAQRVGYKGKPGSRWFSHALDGGHTRGSEHEVVRSMRLAHALGASATAADPVIALTDEESAWASRWLADNGIDDGAPFVGVHPGGSSADKRYPEDRFGKAASRLTEEMGSAVPTVVFGGPDDAARVEGVLDSVENVAVSAGSLTLRRLISLMARVRVMLVNDSGPMHMAAAVGVPLVAIFGPTDHVRWMPRAATAQLVMADDTRPGAVAAGTEESDVHRIPHGWVVEAGRRALAQAGGQR